MKRHVRKAERGGDEAERKTEQLLAARNAIVVCRRRESTKLTKLKNEDISLLGVGEELISIWFPTRREIFAHLTINPSDRTGYFGLLLQKMKNSSYFIFLLFNRNFFSILKNRPKIN